MIIFSELETGTLDLRLDFLWSCHSGKLRSPLHH